METNQNKRKDLLEFLSLTVDNKKNGKKFLKNYCSEYNVKDFISVVQSIGVVQEFKDNPLFMLQELNPHFYKDFAYKLMIEKSELGLAQEVQQCSKMSADNLMKYIFILSKADGVGLYAYDYLLPLMEYITDTKESRCMDIEYLFERKYNKMQKIRLSEKQIQVWESVLDGTNLTVSGGARGGGKSWMAALVGIAFCVKFPGYNMAVFRKIHKVATGKGGVMSEVKRIANKLGIRINPNHTTGAITFPNTSALTCAGLNTFEKVMDHQGMNYNAVIFDEATEIRDYLHVTTLLTSMRSVLDFGISSFSMITCNPPRYSEGLWVREIIKPYLKKVGKDFFPSEHEDKVCYYYTDKSTGNPVSRKRISDIPEAYREGAKTIKFIPSTHNDNKHLDGIAYKKELSQLSEFERMRHEYGSWALQEEDAMFNMRFANFYDRLPFIKEFYPIMTIDTAISQKNHADNTSIQIWYYEISTRNSYLVDHVRTRLDFETLQKTTMRLFKQYSPKVIGIENENAGAILLQILKKMNLPVKALYHNRRDKIERALEIQQFFKQGLIWLPSYEESLIDEIGGFNGKKGRKDDSTDTMIYAMYLFYILKIWDNESTKTLYNEDYAGGKSKVLDLNIVKVLW